MPAQSGLGFVVIPHLDPTHVSHLPELLRRHTPMPVEQAHDGALVQAERVHIIPPNALLTIKGGVLHLGAAVARPGIPRPIDGFLRSLAECQQERAICIIFSGTGSDATLGLKAIKVEGGLVMVQSPDTAEHDGMPRSAIATGLVDYVLPVEQMPAALLEYAEPAPRAMEESAAVGHLEEELASVKKGLESVVTDLESANEELRSRTKRPCR